jgi:hypothetical protein
MKTNFITDIVIAIIILFFVIYFFFRARQYSKQTGVVDGTKIIVLDLDELDIKVKRKDNDG